MGSRHWMGRRCPHHHTVQCTHCHTACHCCLQGHRRTHKQAVVRGKSDAPWSAAGVSASSLLPCVSWHPHGSPRHAWLPRWHFDMLAGWASMCCQHTAAAMLFVPACVCGTVKTPPASGRPNCCTHRRQACRPWGKGRHGQPGRRCWWTAGGDRRWLSRQAGKCVWRLAVHQ